MPTTEFRESYENGFDTTQDDIRSAADGVRALVATDHFADADTRHTSSDKIKESVEHLIQAVLNKDLSYDEAADTAKAVFEPIAERAANRFHNAELPDSFNAFLDNRSAQDTIDSATNSFKTHLRQVDSNLQELVDLHVKALGQAIDRERSNEYSMQVRYDMENAAKALDKVMLAARAD